MSKLNARISVAVALVATVSLIAGGIAIASNTGFKINKPITILGTGQVGQNWTSIPYFNPYGNAGSFCTQTGLTTGIVKASIQFIDPGTGITTTVSCGTAGANAFSFTTGPTTPSFNVGTGVGIDIRQPATAGAPTNLIIVGSHNPALTVHVPFRPGTTVGQKGFFWFSVPYHTTAVTANDLCLSSGLTSSGLTKATVQRVNAATGVATNVTCGTAGASALSLVLGEAVRLIEPANAAGANFNPAHF